MRVLGKFLLATAAGLVVLLVGVLSAIVLGGFAVLERTAPPGNTFLMLEFIAIAILICVPTAIAVACWVLLRAGSNSSEVLSQTQNRLFLNH